MENKLTAFKKYLQDIQDSSNHYSGDIYEDDYNLTQAEVASRYLKKYEDVETLTVDELRDLRYEIQKEHNEAKQCNYEAYRNAVCSLMDALQSTLF